MAPTAVDIAAFARAQQALLDAELQSETAETQHLVASHSPPALQRAGAAVTNLVVTGRRTGPGGRTVLELGPDAATGGVMAEHGVRAGDIVLVAEQPAATARKREMRELEGKGARGVVTRVRRGDVAVALDDGGDEVAFGGRVWIVKLADEVTYKR